MLQTEKATRALKKRGYEFRTPQNFHGGAGRDRTDDLLNAIQALSQLSYSPIKVAEN